MPLGAFGSTLGSILPAAAQDYPSRQVRVIVPFGAGGPADVYARVLAQHLSEQLKQTFVVENRPGAGSIIGTEIPPEQIIELLIRRIRQSMAERGLQLELSEEARDLLVEKGWDPSMGARPLRRAIQRYLEDPLADFVLRSELPEGATVMVDQSRDGVSEGGEAAEPEVSLSIIQPEVKQPVGVGAEGGEEKAADPPAEDGGGEEK